MGGFITVAFYVLIAWGSFSAGNVALGWVGVVLGVASLWVWGVAHNYAVEGSAQRIRQMQENLMTQEGLSRAEAVERTAKHPATGESTSCAKLARWGSPGTDSDRCDSGGRGIHRKVR